LQRRGGVVSYHDPHVPKLRLDGEELQSSEDFTADCTVIITDHSAFDYKRLVDSAPLIVDTRNALKSFQSPKIVRL
jgi:UDP-N-acetyl-D-glucosamine dehydrogenase